MGRSWWTYAVGWKFAFFCAAGVAAILGIVAVKNSRPTHSDAQMKRLATQVFVLSHRTRGLERVTLSMGDLVLSQSKTIGAVVNVQEAQHGILRKLAQNDGYSLRPTRSLASVSR